VSQRPSVNLVSIAVPLALVAGFVGHRLLSQPPPPDTTPLRVPHMLVLSLQPDTATLAGRDHSCACFDEGYDLVALEASLLELKQLQPDKQQIVIVPDGGVPYARLLEVLDIVRPHYPLQTIQTAPHGTTGQ
jgi:hypothetical protein